MYQKIVFATAVTVLTLFLASCGGGSSSSGAAQNNDVTFCVIATDMTSSNNLLRRTYTNTCGFAVNVGFGIITIDSVEMLGIDESFTGLAIGTGHIACRAPSLPFDADSSVSGRDYQCT